MLSSGWQQVSTTGCVSCSVCVSLQVGAVYMTLGQLTRSAQPSAESVVVASRLSHFTSQYIAEVGLDTWLQENGGMTAVLNEMVGLFALSRPHSTLIVAYR